nr:MAG TPA: hypothetical protein [Caudoviricetes sp.]
MNCRRCLDASFSSFFVGQFRFHKLLFRLSRPTFSFTYLWL